MQLVLQTAGVTGDAKNCSYPDRVVVRSAEELREAVRFDHVCAQFKENYRSKANFLQSNVAVMDCDNDFSDEPEEWMTPDKLDGLLPDASYAVAFSRHHMLVKDGRSARPRFHVYFEIATVLDADAYAAIKAGIQQSFPFFDGNALDAARFIFGADCGECIWHDGWETIDELTEPVRHGIEPDGRTIPQGYRNNTLSRFAGKILKRFGESERAESLFRDEAFRCDPPLDEEELRKIWGSALKFYRDIVSRQEGYMPPEEYNSEFKNGSLKPPDYSDIGQAKALAAEYGDELRYSEATDYLRYDGEYWEENRQMAVGAVEEFLDLQLVDAAECVSAASEALIDAGVPEETVRAGGKVLEKAAVTGGAQMLQLYYALKAELQYRAFVMKRRDYKYVVSALNAAKPMLSVQVDQLDRDEFLLNTPYATYDLRKGLSGDRPHDPRDLITKITACSPGKEGCGFWEDALQIFFCGNAELISYVQEIVGMAAVGRVYQEHLVIAYGGGANGKSTFWNTVSRVLGSYSGKLSAETLTVGCRRNVKPEMAELKGKRLIIASEMEEGMRLNTSMVKQLCSTDEVYAEKKYKAPFSFAPSHTLVLYTNYLPRVGANDDGIWRRLVVIPFNARITGGGDIKNYADFLFEKAGQAVMAWIIEGAERAIQNGFKTVLPECVKEASAVYREDNDWFGKFVRECCETDSEFVAKSGELYQRYRAYCMETGEYIRCTADFYAALEKAGFTRKKTRKGVVVPGLQLAAEQDFL